MCKAEEKSKNSGGKREDGSAKGKMKKSELVFWAKRTNPDRCNHMIYAAVIKWMSVQLQGAV